MWTPIRYPCAVFSTSIASSKSLAVSPSIVTIRRSRKSRRPSRSSSRTSSGKLLGLRHDRLRETRRQVVRAQDDLDVHARLAEKAEPLLDLAVGDAAGVRKRGQPDLDDLALAGLERLSVRDADDRVELRVVGQHDPAALLRLEPPHHALARPVEDVHDGPRGARLSRRAGRRLGSAPRARGPCRRPWRRACRRAERRGPSPPGTSTKPKPSGRTVMPPGDQIGELDRRVLLSPDAGDLPAALEAVEPLPQRVLLGLGNVEGAADLGEGEDARPLLPEAVENFGVAGQHAAESTRTAAGERREENPSTTWAPAPSRAPAPSA